MKRIALIISLQLPFAVWAQQKDTTELTPVEVRAVRASPTAPFAKTNLGKAEIARQNLGQDIPFLLNQTPSVVVNADAGNGVGYTGIRIRGTDATRINITLNGIPYNDAESQGTFFVNLPDFVSSVNSIQVQRGVGTSTNGAGAFGATINFSTNEVNRAPYAEVNNSFGSFNTWKNTLKAGTGLLNDHFTADLRVSRISSDGYIDRAASDLKSLYFSTAYLSGRTDLRLNVILGKERTYQAWNGVSEADLVNNRRVNYAGTEKPGTPYNNETDNYWQNHYQFFVTHRFTQSLSFNTALFLTKGKGYYEQYKADRPYASIGLPDPSAGVSKTDLVRQLWLHNDFYGTTFSLQYAKQRSQVILGGAFTNYDGQHFGEVIWAGRGLPAPTHRWYDHDAFKRDANLFLKWQYELTQALSLFADAQYRKVMYTISGFRDNPSLQVDNTYRFFNPKAGLTYHRNNWQAYASYALAQKEPNREDFEAGASRQPKPEQLHDIELGVENKNSRRTVALNLYYMRYSNQLALTGQINDVGAYTRTNIPNSYRLGLELQAGIAATSWLKASGNLNLSRNRILDFKEFIDNYDDGTQKQISYQESDLALSPSIVGAATITITPVKSLSLDLISKYVGKQYLDNTGNEGRRLNPYYVQDARLIYNLQHKGIRNLDLVFGVNNIFNKRYEPNGYTFSYIAGNTLTTENYYFPMAGTNFVVGLNVRLE